jgi:hypothetical protein
MKEGKEARKKVSPRKPDPSFLLTPFPRFPRDPLPPRSAGRRSAPKPRQPLSAIGWQRWPKTVAALLRGRAYEPPPHGLGQGSAGWEAKAQCEHGARVAGPRPRREMAGEGRAATGTALRNGEKYHSYHSY